MTPAPLQRHFDLHLPTGRPLVPMEAAMVLVNRDADDVLNLIACAKIEWAFDIRTEKSERREVRILGDSLMRYLGGENGTRDVDNWDYVVNLVLPGPSEIFIKSKNLARRFGCESQHMINLIREQTIEAAMYPAGGKQSPVVTRESVVRFLKARRIR